MVFKMIYKVNATSIKVHMILLTKTENSKTHMEDPKSSSSLYTEDGEITIYGFKLYYQST